MKEIKLYQCSVCGTNYNIENECVECEKSHKTELKIRSAQHSPYKNNRKGWPVRIFVEDESGKIAEYRLR